MPADSSKWRISKACDECRAVKIKCSGRQPCERCTTRSLDCVYRAKARDRSRKHHEPPAAQPVSSAAVSQDALPLMTNMGHGVPEVASAPKTGSERSIHNHAHSVAATLRAPASGHVLQLYYGPTSNFSLLHSIYHQIEGTRPHSPSRGDVQEIGAGLDLFRHRRLFFGDLAEPSVAGSDDSSIISLSLEASQSFLERYLTTYWIALPVVPKDELRKQLQDMFAGPAILNVDSHDEIIIILAVALGANMAGEDVAASFLFQRAKKGAAKLDDVVNIHVVRIHLMMGHLQLERARPNSAYLHLGTAVRKAIATGLHKEASSRTVDDQDDVERRRITFWSLYFWEIWICFVVGRPSSIPDPGSSMPVPENHRLLRSLVTLARIMSKCVNRIYSQQHDSLLPLWHAANEIRQDLLRFAEQQMKDMKIHLVGDLSHGDQGVRQVMISTMYHHTVLLTFRPFLVLRAKLRQESSSISSTPHQFPSWLDSACEYCLEASRNTVDFLSGTFKESPVCQEIKYHAFFIEGSCYALAFDLLQDTNSGLKNLPWIRSGLQLLRSMLPTGETSGFQLPKTIAAVEHMVRSVIPDFELTDVTKRDATLQEPWQSRNSTMPTTHDGTTRSGEELNIYPSMPFGFDISGGIVRDDSLMIPGEQTDFTAADMGWDVDFGTMDMEAFLSIDPSQALGFIM